METQICMSKLEALCSRGVENRFGKVIVVKDHFSQSAHLLGRAESVVLVTGFCIQETMTGETDGPIGTVVIARALEMLGKLVTIVTDKYSNEFVEAGLDHYKLKTRMINISLDFSFLESENLIESINPDIILFIERPSKNIMGEFNAMSGQVLAGIIPDTDFIFHRARQCNMPILAIGDGGNEAGMALIRDEIEEHVKYGHKICATTKADYLIVSGVSNWGCYTLVGALSVLNKRCLVPSTLEEVEHLRKIVALGAVDGVSKRAEHTVDGYSLDTNMGLLEEVHHIISGLVNPV